MSKRGDFLIATALTALTLGGGIVLAMPDPQPSGWGGAGAMQSISISLGSGQAVEGEADVQDDSSAAQQVDSKKAPENPEIPEEIQEVQEPDPEPVEEVTEAEPEPVVEREPVVEPEPVIEPVTEPEPEPEPVTQLSEIIPPPVKPRPPVVKPEPRPQEVARASPQAEKQAPAPSKAAPEDSVKSDGVSGTTVRSQAASSATGSGGGSSINSAAYVNYQDSVLQTLMQYREYPSIARRRGIEGQNMVRITIERDGSVSLLEIVDFSGNTILDRATEEMINRVRRFPPFPDTMEKDSITLRVPVVYNLR
ncbi:MAG: TonB family protein [Pseudomonadota bacterium]